MDFIKRISEIRSKIVEIISFSQDKEQKIDKDSLKEKSDYSTEEVKEIILTEDEIQKYVQLEIVERLSDKTKNETYSFDFDPLFQKAAILSVEYQDSSAAFLERKLRLDYSRAKKLMGQLESAGIVGPYEGYTSRTVNITNVFQVELLLARLGLLNDERYNHFKKNILPLHEELVLSKVNEEIRAQEISKENELKEILKQEILAKEREKSEKEKRQRLKIQVRKELIEEGIISSINEPGLKREPISKEVLDRVWNRDGGKCVKCGSQEKIEFDHIIPFSKGGSDTYRNLQILCEKCNREKSNSIG